MKRKILILLLLLVALSACRPSNKVIKDAISDSIIKNIPTTWSGSLLGGKALNIYSLEIVKVGKYNKHGEYYPVKVHCHGTAEADLLFDKKINEFDKDGEFHVFQDEYGEWKARYSGGL